ncbi:MAG: RNA-binding domain-containing protein [Verrucomicrobiota bacterium]
MTPPDRQIKAGESETIEFVNHLENLESVSKHVVAFLNSGGGTIFVGVDDDGTIVGVPNAENVAKRLYADLQKTISPKALFSVTTEPQENKQLVVIEVPGAKDTPFVSDGTLYLRKGKHSVKATGDDLQELLQDRSVEVERWERRGSPVLTLKELDQEEIRRTVGEAAEKNRFQFRKPEEPEAVLMDLGMWSRGMLTQAADVCFGQKPAMRNPQVRVRVYAFESDKGGNYLDQDDISGPIATVIERANVFIRRNSPLAAKFLPESLKRNNIPAYPDYAIREGLVNALAHRDYASFSSGATVTLYPDRVEIWNSGRLPKGWNADKLRHNHPSLPPNPDIAHVLFIRSFMERIGRGTQKIIEACREAGLPPAAWSADGDGITLTIYNHASEGSPQQRWDNRQRKLMESLKPGDAIAPGDYLERFATGIGDRQARRDLGELEASDFLRREGKGKATVYVRTQRVWKS